MAQELKLVARTFEMDTVAKLTGFDSQELIDSTSDDLEILSGKAAGVCYMPDDYFENGVQDVEKAIKRAKMTSKSGHHSVFDHGHLTFVLKTNKMMAMILNSLGVYTTSEKSARYTKMQPETELELQMYNKWKTKIQELILNKYPDTDDAVLNTRMRKALNIEDKNEKVVKDGKLLVDGIRLADEILETNKKSDTLPSMKLAMENARYMISVFTSTTMMYTISLRQAYLTVGYLYDLYINLEHAEDELSEKLKPYVLELYKEFERVLGDSKLHDNKNQHIRFLEAQHVGELIDSRATAGREFKTYTDLERRLEAKRDVIGDTYTVTYSGSLAMLAQAQRHRTLRYSMKLQKIGESGYYVPDIVGDAGLTDEWLNDIKSVSYCVPQGTLVKITEQGLFEDFALKCKERMCGRAQLEIMKSTVDLVNIFAYNYQNLSYSNVKLLENITEAYEDGKGFKACARCKFGDFKCTEGCTWGPNKALDRLI